LISAQIDFRECVPSHPGLEGRAYGYGNRLHFVA
jgi:hypothetical protein